MQAMLELKGISTHYGAICAVNNVSLHVNQGEIVSLIGSNGAGKTSLLMTLCGNPRASSGQVLYEGEDITNAPSHLIMRKGIAISPEGRRIFPALTVVENLQMGGFFQSKDAIAEGMEYAFKLFPRLKDRANQRAQEQQPQPTKPATRIRLPDVRLCGTADSVHSNRSSASLAASSGASCARIFRRPRRRRFST